MAVEFFVTGIPKSMSVGKTVRWKTKDGSRQGQHQTRENTEWASIVGLTARDHAPIIPWSGPIALHLSFYMPRPKSGKNAKYPTKRPDIDNLIHKLTDQMNGVLWADDSQIVDLVVSKKFAPVQPYETTGLHVYVEEIA